MGKGGFGKGKGGGKGGKGDGKKGGKGKGKGGKKGGKGKGKGKGKGGVKKAAATIKAHGRFQDLYICQAKDESLVTRSIAPGISVYGEKAVKVKAGEVMDKDGGKALAESTSTEQERDAQIEYRVWNPFRSKLGASIVGGIKDMPVKEGAKVLYLGGASGTTVSHVSDMVGPTGRVYAVEFSHRPGRELTNMAKARANVVPIVEDARYPLKYRMLVGACDVVFADVAQPDQARIVQLNAEHFLKNEGWFIISIKANCVDSTAAPEAVYASEIDKLKKGGFKPKEYLTLEPYHRDHAVVIGKYRVAKKNKDKA